MKLLLANKYYAPVQGGIEQHVQDLAEGLVKSARDNNGSLPLLEDYGELILEVLVANSVPVGVKEEIGGVTVRRVASFGRLSSAPVSPGLPFVAAGSDADIVHAHFPSPPVELIGRLLPEGRLLVVTFHSSIVRQQILGAIYSPLVKAYLKRADRIIVTSPNLLEETEILKPHKQKCRVVPLGIDPEPFCPGEPVAARALEEEAAQLKAVLGGRPIVLFVGRLVYYKGIDYLIDAFSQAIITHEGRIRSGEGAGIEGEADSRPGRPLLVLVGAGPLEEELRRQCRALDVIDDVHFAGAVSNDQLPAYYHASQFLVLPSVAASEAFGLVQLEAHASGKPVISTDLPTGVPFVNLNGVTGKIVPPRDVVALATAIIRLLDDPGLSEHLGEQGRARFFSEFTRDIMVERVIGVYAELLESQEQSYEGEGEA